MIFLATRNNFLLLMISFALILKPAGVCADTLESIAMMPDSVAQHGLAIEHWTNPNGVRVYYVHAPDLPMLDIKVVFNAGSARDDKKPGVAYITNSMLDEGADTLSADDIASQFDQIGAQYGALSARDMAFVQLRTLTNEQSLRDATSLFSRIIQAPTFPQQSLTRIKNQILASLTRQQKLPQAIGKKYFFAASYKGHPYGTPTDGTIASIPIINRNDLINHYHRFYVGKNAIVALVGDIDRSTAEKISLRLTDALPAGESAPTLPTPPALKDTVNTHIEFDSAQTHIFLGGPSITRHDPDYIPLYVANYIFGGSGFGSILMEEIREKRGLAYVASSDLTAMNAPGPFIVNIQTRNDQASEALSITQNALTDFIKAGPTEEQLKKAKLQITGEFPLSIANNAAIVDHIASVGFYNLPDDYYVDFLTAIDQLTVEQVTHALQKHIHPDQLVTVTVGKKNDEKK